MTLENQIPAATAVDMKTSQCKCPCEQNKCHLGISQINPKQPEATPKLQKVQKEFFLGHGIKTNNPVEAAKIFLERDHEKLQALLFEYRHGKLGVYMVPLMFYGDVPEAVDLSKFNDPKRIDKVEGDKAERTMYYALEKYYKETGDDVLIIHSHKFLNNKSNNEKDFIVLNLSKCN